MQENYIGQTNIALVLKYVNLTVILVGILIAALLLVVVVQFRTHRVQTGFFLYSICVVLAGLSLQLACCGLLICFRRFAFRCTRHHTSWHAPSNMPCRINSAQYDSSASLPRFR